MTCRLAALIAAALLSTPGISLADALPCAVAGGPTTASRPSAEARTTGTRSAGQRFVRTELLFGAARPGGEVTETEFKQFLEQCITPRFPDGLTLLVGRGQFRGADGIPIQERSILLILLYPHKVQRERSRRIDEIRDAYKRIFQQESVLRSDRCCERVRF